MAKNTACILTLCCALMANALLAQNHNLLTYAGGSGRETFYDVLPLTNGSVLVCGYADDLDWTGNAPKTELAYTGAIPNGQGSNRYGFILQLSPDLQKILQVVHFPKGAVEDIRYLKTNTPPYTPTGDLYLSCNTADSDANDGGYLIAALDHNFVDGIPTQLRWHQAIWAKSVIKENHPWDVDSQGRVYYITGEPYGYDWSAVYSLDRQGQRRVVEHWRTHWLKGGGEWRGVPAGAYPQGGIDSIAFSGIVLKAWGRCDLRSWTQNEYQNYYPDGNGGFRKGRWPLDVLYNSPCDPANPTANGPGYTGYSPPGTPVYGGQCIVVNKLTDDVYLGMNFKSVLPGGMPDFEPAVVAMDATGQLRWWSRLYHEITPAGDTLNSSPDQYIDALAIDYTHQHLVVGARCHGNNVENFWEGNSVDAIPGASGFQNRFTGSSGNIHISWLGKLRLTDGVLSHATYLAELAEGTAQLGAPHPDPNLDGWPNPNSGWPDVNTTRMARQGIKVSHSGDVAVIATGRRTITTANAYQKMVLPYYGGLSTWNSFVRVYDAPLQTPKYSSLVVGVWDTLTQAGGGNTELFGLYKTVRGVIGVGRQTASAGGIPNGAALPVVGVPEWGADLPQNESAILFYYTADNLYHPGDTIQSVGISDWRRPTTPTLKVYPNPGNEVFFVSWQEGQELPSDTPYQITDVLGKVVHSGQYPSAGGIRVSLPSGVYLLQINLNKEHLSAKLIIDN